MILIVTIAVSLGLVVGATVVVTGGLYLGSTSGCPYCREKLGLT